MATQAEMRAEELVYEVAEELGLTEIEVLELKHSPWPTLSYGTSASR